MLDQGLAERQFLLAGGNHFFGIPAHVADHVVDQLRIVVRVDAQRVARLEAQPGAFDGQLQVAGFLVRAAAVEVEVLQDFGGKGIRAGKGRRRQPPGRPSPGRRAAAGRGTGFQPVCSQPQTPAGTSAAIRSASPASVPAGCRSAPGRGKGVEHAVHPGLGRLVEIDVAIDPRVDPLRAEFLQPCVKILAGLAELIVKLIAQRKHGEPHAFQPRGPLAMDEFVEQHRLVRRIAFAVRADHDQKLLDLFEVVRAELAHARQRDRETLLFQPFLHFAGQPLGVAGLGAEENRHVALDRRRGRSSGFPSWQVQRPPLARLLPCRRRRCANQPDSRSARSSDRARAWPATDSGLPPDAG